MAEQEDVLRVNMAAATEDLLRVKGPVVSPEFSSSFEERRVESDEALCFYRLPQSQLSEQPALRSLEFCRVFEVDPRIGCVVEPKASSASTPSKSFVDNPGLNCSFALGAVFRIMRMDNNSMPEFSTGWVASPLILAENNCYMFYAVCTAHSFRGLEVADYFKGSFGQAGKPKHFRFSGFPIDKEPMLCVHNDGADFAIIRCIVPASERRRMLARHMSFLLPCSPTQYGTEGTHLATFGYSSFTRFRKLARRELLEEDGAELGLWELYGAVFESKRRLYNAICSTMDFETGVLCCSPTIAVHLRDNYVTLRSSTAFGCSGAPVMPNEFEGVVCYTHRGREPASTGYDIVNRATGLDHDEFVSFYAQHILKYIIPSKLKGRAILPFKKWCDLHNLVCPV